MKRIEFGRFQITETARKNVIECLDSGWITMGEKTRLFESKFRKLFNYPFCRLLSSGTVANTAAILSLYEINSKWSEVNEVICPALSFIASGSSIVSANMTPVFVDVGWDLNIDPDKIEEKITKNTRAILTVNLMGKCANLSRIKEIADKYNLPILVDNCEAYGATHQSKYSLEYGDWETTSHFSAHILAISEGGVAFTKDKYKDELIEGIRSHGRMGGTAYFDHSIFGINGKPTDLAASIGLAELDTFWENFNIRKDNLKFFLDGLGGYEDLILMNGDITEDAPHGLNFVFKKPGLYQTFADEMDKAGIHIKRTFGSMQSHGLFKKMGYTEDCPIASYIGNNSGHIGVHRFLTEEDKNYVVKATRNILDKLKYQ